MINTINTSVRRAVISAAFVGAIWLAHYLDQPRVPDVANPGFELTDVTKEAGIEFVHQRATLDPKLANVEAHIVALGASVSVVDFDRDGWFDLYFTNSHFDAPNTLYRNLGNGKFEQVAESLGIARVNRKGEGVSMGAIWGDIDNDTWEDLLIYKYGYLQLFKNVDGKRFVDITDSAGIRRWLNSNSAVWLDYDRDGLLDLYVTSYFRSDIDLWNVKDTKIMQNSFNFANNGGKNVLFHNLGGGKFEDVTEAYGVAGNRWTLAVAAADFNDDGWIDMYVANDYGIEELYLNEEGRRFINKDVGLDDRSKSGMSVALGDVRNRGRLDAYITNINQPAYLFQGNNLRVNYLPLTGKFANEADANISDAGWGWGSQFGDLNNDGRLDLVVMNGFISADTTEDYYYEMNQIAIANREFFEDAANWPAFGDQTLSGYERSKVFLNRGDSGWADVAEKVGMTDLYDGRGVALADLGNRGVLDVIVANQGQPALLYRNQTDGGNHWVAFKLVATKSNRSAIGAELLVASGGVIRRGVVDGGMGFASQNDRRPHFGLGSTNRIDSVVVRWPSGTTQVVKTVQIDAFNTITEQ